MLSLQDYPLILEQDVIWSDMDAMGHVNNTVYFRYFEDGRIALFEKIGGLSLLESQGLGPILANERCDFRRPLHYPDRIRIGVRVCELAEKKFLMGFAVYSEKQQTLVAEGDGLVVFYDYRNGRSCQIPESIASALREMGG